MKMETTTFTPASSSTLSSESQLDGLILMESIPTSKIPETGEPVNSTAKKTGTFLNRRNALKRPKTSLLDAKTPLAKKTGSVIVSTKRSPIHTRSGSGTIATKTIRPFSKENTTDNWPLPYKNFAGLTDFDALSYAARQAAERLHGPNEIPPSQRYLCRTSTPLRNSDQVL